MGRSSKEYLDQCMKEMDKDPFYQQMQDKRDQDWWKQQEDEQRQMEAENEDADKG